MNESGFGPSRLPGAGVRAPPGRTCAAWRTGCSVRSAEAEDAVQERGSGWIGRSGRRTISGLADRGRRADLHRHASGPRGASRDAAVAGCRSRSSTPAGRPVPSPEAAMADSVGLALLVVLEDLSPPSGWRSCCTTCSASRSTRSARSSVARRRRPGSWPAGLDAGSAGRRPPDADLATQRRRGRLPGGGPGGRLRCAGRVLEPDVVFRIDVGEMVRFGRPPVSGGRGRRVLEAGRRSRRWPVAIVNGAAGRRRRAGRHRSGSWNSPSPRVGSRRSTSSATRPSSAARRSVSRLPGPRAASPRTPRAHPGLTILADRGTRRGRWGRPRPQCPIVQRPRTPRDWPSCPPSHCPRP